jgi:hypothetical protein
MLLFYFTLLLGINTQAPAANVGGVWTLNREASDMPREIGFNAPWLQQGARGAGGSTGGNQSGSTGGGRGGRRGGGGGGGGGGVSGSPFGAPSESYDDARRVQFLTGEARSPAMRITIVDTPTAITITNELGQSRTLHPTGRDEEVEVGGVPLIVSTKQDASALVVTYIVGKERQVRYTYTPSASPAQLVVDVQFLEHGSGDKARLVYEPGIATETTGAATATGPKPAAGTPASQPAAPMPAGTDTRPGAELRGLKEIGVLVEDLGPQAQSCGLTHDAIESAVAKRLGDAGFTVRRNSDEDTYLYVNIQTSTVAGGVCVSRYDAFLYTQGTATLTYREQPVLVQISLMHRGGIGTSAPSGHASAVTRALENYVDVMVTQVRDANK